MGYSSTMVDPSLSLVIGTLVTVVLWVLLGWLLMRWLGFRPRNRSRS